MYLKRKLETCRIQIQVKKVGFVTIKQEKNNLKILTKTHIIYLKRKLRTYEIQIQVEKV